MEETPTLNKLKALIAKCATWLARGASDRRLAQAYPVRELVRVVADLSPVVTE